MASFQRRILDFYDCHGRKHLPWQQNPTPYQVWVSEIMLQQTQVSTVIPYFERFMQRFPSVDVLAEAPVDDVLEHWTGLGYYSRARNLHTSARHICQHHKGQLPQTLEQLMSLPGIGRSTAGAIRSLGSRKYAPILDGNVKRVLCRHFGVEGWPGKNQVLKQLWQLSEALTPQQRCGQFNQAMMDMGALVCTRSKPQCEVCPISTSCQAKATDRVADLPTRKAQSAKPTRHSTFVLAVNQSNEVLLQRRAPQGIWGGLWTPPEFQGEAEELSHWCEHTLGAGVARQQYGEPFRHTLSHFHWQITPCYVVLSAPPCRIMDAADWCWVAPDKMAGLGTSAAVKKILKQLECLHDA